MTFSGPDLDDLLGETRTNEHGYFQVAGATREAGPIEVIIKIYHDCLDEHRVSESGKVKSHKKNYPKISELKLHKFNDQII